MLSFFQSYKKTYQNKFIAAFEIETYRIWVIKSFLAFSSLICPLQEVEKSRVTILLLILNAKTWMASIDKQSIREEFDKIKMIQNMIEMIENTIKIVYTK